MSLDEIWKESPTQILGKRVDQIIGFAGDGKLGDKNSAPAEFHAFLKRVPVDVLERYADECLTQSFTDSGLALQDIVNEMAFPTTLDGRWVYLCWQSDEPNVAYWHEVSGGYAGRRRITAGQMQRLGRLDDPARHEDSALDF